MVKRADGPSVGHSLWYDFSMYQKTKHVTLADLEKVNAAESKVGAGPGSRSTCPRPFVSTQDAQRQLEDGLCDRLSPLMQQDAAASVLTSLPRRRPFAGGGRPRQPGNVDDASAK